MTMERSKMLWFLVLALLLAGCGASSGPPAETTSTPSASAVADVEVVAVTSQKLDLVVTLPAELAPYESVAIYARTTGFVKAISVDRGSSVKQGQLLVTVEAPELAAQRSEAESKLAAAQAQLGAAQAKLSADQVTYERLSVAARTPGVVAGNELDLAARAADGSQSMFAAAQNSVKAAEAARNAIAEIEEYLRITAPFDGEITERNVHPGALVGPAGGSAASVPLLRIQTTNRLRLVVPVPENSVADVPLAARVKFTVPAYPAEVFQAPVARISRAIDPKTRTMPVELEISNAAGKLTPGTFCQVQWPVRRTEATHFVPFSAVTSNQQRTFVIRIPQTGSNVGKAEWVDVRTGAHAGNLVEVFGDLNNGDQVVLRASDTIRPRDSLSPRLNAETR